MIYQVNGHKITEKGGYFYAMFERTPKEWQPREQAWKKYTSAYIMSRKPWKPAPPPENWRQGGMVVTSGNKIEFFCFFINPKEAEDPAAGYGIKIAKWFTEAEEYLL